MSTVSATSRVQEIRDRTAAIQQKNAEKAAAAAAQKAAQPKTTATSRVQEIRNRTDAIQQKNAEKSQGSANVGQAGVSTAKSTARTSNTDTVSISTRSNSSSYAGQYKDMSDESLDKTINNLKNTIKNSKSGTATYYAQKALEGYEAEKERRKNYNGKNSSPSHLLFWAKNGMINTGERDQEGGHLIDFSKTTYESISKTTDASSYQYAILNDKFEEGGYTYIDKNGLCRSSKIKGQKSSNDYYVVAMGNKFEQCAKLYDGSYDKNTAEAMAKNNSGKILNYTSNKTVNVGYTFRVDLMDADGNKFSIDVLMADSKGDSNSFIPHDNVVEFFVDGKPNSQICSKKDGNIDYAALVGASSKTSIQSISIYEDSARYTGIYAPNGWRRV